MSRVSRIRFVENERVKQEDLRAVVLGQMQHMRERVVCALGEISGEEDSLDLQHGPLLTARPTPAHTLPPVEAACAV